MKPVFFRSAAEFRRWLAKRHKTAAELWVGFYKKASGKTGISYEDAVRQALCYGWIDGIKKRVDEHAFMHRFSPRTGKSAWSASNIRRVAELKKLGLMTSAGLTAWNARTPDRLYERPPESFDGTIERRLKKNRKAWTFFEQRPPGYRRMVVRYIMSARQEATRLRRLERLIESWEQGRARTGM